MVKQRVGEYVTTKIGGGTMQLMILLKRNKKNGSRESYEKAKKNIS